MSLLLVSDQNLRAIKMALRARINGTRSSHVTEALAYSMGFNTHAALLAQMKVDRLLPPAVGEADGVRFAARLASLVGVTVPATLLDEVVRSDAIPDRPYVEFFDHDRSVDAVHFAECSRKNRPMIMVRRARADATLEWDCITTDGRLKGYPFGNDNGDGIASEMVRLFEVRVKNAPGKPQYRGTAFTGWVHKLQPEAARQLAEDYFRLLYLPLRTA